MALSSAINCNPHKRFYLPQWAKNELLDSAQRLEAEGMFRLEASVTAVLSVCAEVQLMAQISNKI